MIYEKKEIRLDKINLSYCKHIKLRLANINDAEFILNLRLDPELNRHVSKVESNLEQQKQWLRSYKKREQKRNEFYFIIESKQGAQFGAVRLYDFKEDSFCWGSWIIKRCSPNYAAIESALTIYEFAFYELGFYRSHFDVRKGNERVIKFHEHFGAKRISSNAENYYFNFEKTDYEVTKMRYKKYFASTR